MHSVIQDSIYKFFASPEFAISVGLRAYPANYQGEIAEKEFLRFHILGPRVTKAHHAAGKRYEGSLIISFLSPAGQGDKRSYAVMTQIARMLDTKTFPDTLSFSTGSINNYGLDSVNKSLWRVDYTNNFLIFGE